MHILVIGNPVEGFRFEGLFTNEATAAEYGELAYPGTEWWVAPLVLKLNWKETLRNYASAAKDISTPIGKYEYCACGHSWEQHQQNVHGLYVCGQCNCRGMQPPSENLKSLPDDF